MNDLLTFQVCLRRQSWENNEKLLCISNRGAMSVVYRNRRGYVMTSNYILYVADLKADDWVRVRITAPTTRKGTAETFILDNRNVEAWLKRNDQPSKSDQSEYD